MTDPWNEGGQTDFEGQGEDGALYVDFSSDEAASESRDLEPLPTGKYLCTISDVNLKACGPEAKNPGKPYYAIEFTVAEDVRGGEFRGRKCWTNAMLFHPALFTITHIMKAIGHQVNEGRVRIPKPEELIGQVVLVGGIKLGEQTDKNDPTKKYAPKFEPKSFFGKDKWKKASGVVTTAAGKQDPADLLS